MNPTLYILIVIPVLLLAVWYYYNQLAQKRNQIENAISSTDALFIKRSDLIPNLIATVQQYMQFEKETLTKITALRSTKSNSNPELERLGTQALKGLMVQVENYPKLKANSQFINLQYSMNEVEEQISAGRRYISSSITDYNNAIQLFPSNLVAKLTGFSKYDWQYASTTQKENINANELFKS